MRSLLVVLQVGMVNWHSNVVSLMPLRQPPSFSETFELQLHVAPLGLLHDACGIRCVSVKALVCVCDNKHLNSITYYV